jgi:hypothetical protein
MLTGLSSFLKYYEKKGIYFPVKKMDLTPKEWEIFGRKCGN